MSGDFDAAIDDYAAGLRALPEGAPIDEADLLVGLP
jgi:hypothetical protein